MGEKDYAEKTLEAYEDVFADIVNGLFFKGEQVLQQQSLTDAQTFSTYKAAGKKHPQERDISKYWIKNGGEKAAIRIAFFGIENQTKYDKDMPLRIIGYDGAAYRAQLLRQEQSERYPVMTIVLYFGRSTWGKNRSLLDVLDVPEQFLPYVSNYKINVFEISRLPEEAIEYFHSDFRVIVDYFVRKRENPDYRPSDPVKFQHAEELLELMTVLTGDDRFMETRTEEGGIPTDMCEVLDRVEARGVEKGIKEGIKEGTLQTLFRLVDKGMISLEDASKEAGMTPAEFMESRGESRGQVH